MRELLTKIIYAAALPVLLAAMAFAVYRFVIAPKPGAEPPPIERAEESGEPENPVLPGIEAENPKIKHFVDGKVKWTMGAESISSEDLSGQTVFSKSSGVFVREEGFELEFAAPLMIYDRAEKTVRVEGGVSGTLKPEGHEMSARQMEWKESSDELSAADAVVKVDGGSIRGDEMRLKREGRRVAMEGNVVIELELNREKR
ncbi:MAG: hypothetical protein BWY28_02942 [bacterium ADurb.Bin236]|nr:MAG: hypothetical protein BWY28_02942 [bacterium ADurb.Bin236]